MFLGEYALGRCAGGCCTREAEMKVCYNMDSAPQVQCPSGPQRQNRLAVPLSAFILVVIVVVFIDATSAK